MKGHKWFASIYDRMLAPQEEKFLRAIRREMLSDVAGDVLEVGAGTGANFEFYAKEARVIAVEPDPYMLERAKGRAAEAASRIDLRQAPAEDLPFPDAAFDYVIGTLVLCSVSDPRKALSEIKRVLKPGSQYRLYEHVRYENPIGALAQTVMSPAWQWFGAGCHPNRATGRLVEEAGFEILSATVHKPSPPISPLVITRPHLRAVARRPA
jgi:ubiquinone/menaquinone biosynthesis C-methylase UbiE